MTPFPRLRALVRRPSQSRAEQLWRARVDELTARNEQLEQEKTRLLNRIAELNAELRGARLVQMADYSTGRQP